MKIEEHYFFARDLELDYPVAVRGEGVWIWDKEGNQYLDACAGANVTSIGHGVKSVAEAAKKQTESIAYVPGVHFLNEPALELAERLIEMAPPGFSRVMLLSGGSEAMENALKIARQYHVYRGCASRYRFVSRWQGFHGNTVMMDAASGHTGRRTISMPMLPGVPHIVPACCYRCPFDKCYPDCGISCAEDLERVVKQEGAEHIAAFVCETIVGAAAAAVTPVPEYYPRIREICDRHEILWVADEIMSGAGRTGRFAAIEHWGVLPDIIVLAKGLSSGYAPLSAILINEKVFRPFLENTAPYVGGHTYNAHPVTSSVGLAVLDYAKTHRLMEGVAEKGSRLLSGLQSLEQKSTIMADVRGKGLMWGFELVEDKKTKKPFDPTLQVSQRTVQSAMRRGLVIYPVVGCADGQSGDGILISPPLTITNNEIDILLERLEATILEIESSNY
jgi:adenosylmethionine-8-amino-7-oxononanoate aminotransferase